MINNQIRDARIYNELEEVRQEGNLMVTDCEYEGLQREDYWVLWIKGKEKTLW